MIKHTYNAQITWTGDTGRGTADYAAYSRSHEVAVEGKPVLIGSADTAFRGDADKWNPEDSLLGSISACHMLWFLHLAASEGWIVRRYVDNATAQMQMNPDGSGQFVSALLRPSVLISSGDLTLSNSLHHRAHAMCFIARSLNFDVTCEASTSLEQVP